MVIKYVNYQKWLEAFAIPSQEATIVAKVLVNNLINRFRVSLELNFEQRVNFKSAASKTFCELFGQHYAPVI